MDLKSVKVLAVLAAIIGSAQAGANLPSDNESAKAVADLIQTGKLKVDTKTGKVMLNTSVLDVLREAGMVTNLKAEDVKVAGGGQSSGGQSCY